MEQVTDVGPAGLVPAAWLLAVGAQTSVVSTRTVFVALVVMDIMLGAFFLASLSEMTGVLAAWQTVIVAGLLATLLGTADMAIDPATNPLVPVTLLAWMLLPAAAFVPTGRVHADDRLWRIYLGAGALSVLGAGLYALGQFGSVAPATTPVAGLAVVGLGQTAGIVTAVVQNS
jgi:hypothetical protein